MKNRILYIIIAAVALAAGGVVVFYLVFGDARRDPINKISAAGEDKPVKVIQPDAGDSRKNPEARGMSRKCEEKGHIFTIVYIFLQHLTGNGAVTGFIDCHELSLCAMNCLPRRLVST